tara:strand:+ start:1122 stop:1271 length:150 start_codon:yes stop_codon:yes gene_type:complete
MIKELDFLDTILYFEIQGIFVFWWVVILLVLYFIIDNLINFIIIKRGKK